jgi:IS30 family transposase
MIGSSDKHSVLTLVDRKTGYLMLGKLEARTAKATNRRAIALMRRAQRRVRTITVDNGTEFHGYKDIEAATAARIYFATPHHSWERGTCENTNGLLRQYLPKRKSLAHVSQADCNRIARRLNHRPANDSAFSPPRSAMNYTQTAKPRCTSNLMSHCANAVPRAATLGLKFASIHPPVVACMVLVDSEPSRPPILAQVGHRFLDT